MGPNFEFIKNLIWNLIEVSDATDRVSFGDVDLENIFDKIASIVSDKQSTAQFQFDKISNKIAFVITRIVSTHSVYFNYFILTFIAVTLVTIGSFSSISSIPYTALPPTKIHPLFHPTDFDVDQDCHITYKNDKKSKGKHDIMDEKHAIILPLTSSIVLCGLYLLIKKFNIEWTKYVMWLLNINIKIVNISSTTFVATYLLHASSRLLSSIRSKWNPLYYFPRYRLTISDDNEDIHANSGIVSNFGYKDSFDGSKLYYQDYIDEINKDPTYKQLYKRELVSPTAIKPEYQIFNVYFDNASLSGFVIGLITTILYHLLPNNWLMINIVSVNMAVWAISNLKLKNLRSGVFILIALFFYDIYFVFGTDIMVTVATNIDLPVKLSVPTTFNTTQSKFEFAMLGLGDIALPGMFIAMCYKFDIWKFHYDNNDTEFHLMNKKYIGKYFIAACVSYTLAMVTCMAALTVYNTAQPALLYIVPSLIISTVSTAWFSNEFNLFWTFQYDTIELGENVLKVQEEESSDNDNSTITMTYAEYIMTDNDDQTSNDEEDYTEENAIFDGDKFDYDKFEYDSEDLDDTITLD